MLNVSSVFVLLLAALAGAYFISSSRRMAVLVGVAAFVSRPAFEVGGLNVRIELAVGLLCFLRLIHERFSRQGQAFSPGSLLSICATFGWVILAAITSLTIAPFPKQSLSVLAWCVLNIMTALWIARSPSVWFVLIRTGTIAAMTCCMLAIVFWLSATYHMFIYGVQVDPTYGGFAAYVFSIEANILGGLLCLWALVAVYNPMGAVPRFVRISLALATPLAIIATHTRAALVAYVVGLVATLLFRPESRRLAQSSLLLGGTAGILLLFGSSVQGLGKFMEVFDVSGGTGGLRYRVNSIAISEWWSSPDRLVGLGWNSFGQRHIDDTQPLLMLPSYIGNLPIQIAYDGGIIGIVSFVLAAGACAICIARKGYSQLLMIFAVPYLIFSIATSALWLLETWMFVGLAWGLIAKSNDVGSALTTRSKAPFRMTAAPPNVR